MSLVQLPPCSHMPSATGANHRHILPVTDRADSVSSQLRKATSHQTFIRGDKGGSLKPTALVTMY